jgi:hypothetical protein
MVNVSGLELTVDGNFPGNDLISGEYCGAKIVLKPWQYRWIRGTTA